MLGRTVRVMGVLTALVFLSASAFCDETKSTQRNAFNPGGQCASYEAHHHAYLQDQ